MPLKLNVGVSRKLGLPEYSSVGASCNVEVELDPGLLHADLDGFHERVRSAYVACHRAVHDELSRLLNAPAPAATGRGSRLPENVHPGRHGDAGGPDRPRKPATPSQLKAIEALARRRDADLSALLRDGVGVGRPEDLTVREASRLIDLLKAAPAA